MTMSLTDLIQVIPPDNEDEEAEDIFAFAAGLIFTDDVRNFHGDDRSLLVYKSTRFGDIELRAADPVQEDDRKLFAQCLWNAGIKMAEMISQESDECWCVKRKRVLELGAGGKNWLIAKTVGVGLGGIVACLAGASDTVISDYPADVLLENIRRNVKHALPDSFSGQCDVQGYAWGDVESDFAKQNVHSFDRIIAADCYWMPHQHENLVKSMLHMLRIDPAARVLAIAGFHTGRAKLAGFFEEAVEQGLDVEDIYEEDAKGVKRGVVARAGWW
ncbi:hypothetical protein CBER1_04633 [Cercospora berteroae]|uniref:Uncharacterized protein n=1 Tax=Cercospora berteroae TaxID=357750 RepID=A0A2S6C2E9_9PEZI|nr:hypothetical protein CBER1_04633 [Cercospora berteroae]